jgi:hypothetical protein
VQVFWHNDKGVQPESTLVSVSEDRVHQKFRVRGSEKQGSSLKRDGSDGIGIDGAPPHFDSREAYPRMVAEQRMSFRQR